MSGEGYCERCGAQTSGGLARRTRRRKCQECGHMVCPLCCSHGKAGRHGAEWARCFDCDEKEVISE